MKKGEINSECRDQVNLVDIASVEFENKLNEEKLTIEFSTKLDSDGFYSESWGIRK